MPTQCQVPKSSAATLGATGCRSHPAASCALGLYRGRGKALSPEQAGELRRRAGAGEQKTGLAREFGISRETLYQYDRQLTHLGHIPVSVFGVQIRGIGDRLPKNRRPEM